MNRISDYDKILEENFSRLTIKVVERCLFLSNEDGRWYRMRLWIPDKEDEDEYGSQIHIDYTGGGGVIIKQHLISNQEKAMKKAEGFQGAFVLGVHEWEDNTAYGLDKGPGKLGWGIFKRFHRLPCGLCLYGVRDTKDVNRKRQSLYLCLKGNNIKKKGYCANYSPKIKSEKLLVNPIANYEPFQDK